MLVMDQLYLMDHSDMTDLRRFLLRKTSLDYLPNFNMSLSTTLLIIRRPNKKLLLSYAI